MMLPIPTFSFCSVEAVGAPAFSFLPPKLLGSVDSLGCVAFFFIKPKADRLLVERTRGLIVPFAFFRAPDLESRTCEIDEDMVLVASVTGAMSTNKDEAEGG
jgi:hypothetical protein